MKKKAAGRADGKNKIGKNEVRKRAAVMNLTWLTVWLLSFAGMAVFYELKCQAVIGAVYQSNPRRRITLINSTNVRRSLVLFIRVIRRRGF